MATTAPQTKGAGPLGFMQSLSPRVYLWRLVLPDNARTAPATDNPTLIIIFGWMNAGGGPLAKYVRQYQALFPDSAILLVTCTFAGMTFPWIGLPEARIAAIATRGILEQDEAQETTSQDANTHPRLLVHAFSNGGSTMLYHFYNAFKATGSSKTPESTILPLHATIFDSMPAPFSYQILVQGILDGANSATARLIILPIAYLYVALVWLVIKVLRIPDHIGDLGPRAHNDLTCVREAYRTYMYSTADRITPAAAVERHADEAEAKGFRVQREVFEGTGHVAHARKYADRYWRIVAQTWERARLGEPAASS